MRQKLLPAIMPDAPKETILRRRRSLRILPAGIHRQQAGRSGFLASVSRQQAGTYATAGTPGFNVYVGVDAAPDLASSPTFTDTLPFQVATTPPVSGTKAYNVLVRAVSAYGLESQNRLAYSFVIDSTGNLLPPAISMPDMSAYVSGYKIRVLATYPGWLTEASKASHWRLWIKATPPDPDVDTPLAAQAVTGRMMKPMLTGALVAGTWHVALCLYRASDASRSEPARATAVIPPVPETPFGSP